VLQLSRLTVVFDEQCISGQGNGRCFVRRRANDDVASDLVRSHRSVPTPRRLPTLTCSPSNPSTRPRSLTPASPLPVPPRRASTSSPSTSPPRPACPSS
jgi:hypothetical protein